MTLQDEQVEADLEGIHRWWPPNRHPRLICSAAPPSRWMTRSITPAAGPAPGWPYAEKRVNLN